MNLKLVKMNENKQKEMNRNSFFKIAKYESKLVQIWRENWRVFGSIKMNGIWVEIGHFKDEKK